MFLKSVTGDVLFESRAHSIKEALTEAVSDKVNLRNVNLRGAVLRNMHLRGADMRGACLWGADLRGALLEGVDLTGADLRVANLTRCYFKGGVISQVDFRGAEMEAIDFNGCDVSYSKFTQKSVLQAADGSFIRQEGAILSDEEGCEYLLKTLCFKALGDVKYAA